VQPDCIDLAVLPLALNVVLSSAPQAKFTISILNTGFTSSIVVLIALLPQSIQYVPNCFISFLLDVKISPANDCSG